MKTVGRLLAKGLLTILPIVLTVYFIYWLGVTTESLLSGLLKVWLPAEIYIPGMGLVAGFVVLIVIGLLVNAYVVRRVITFSESLILRIPVVKTVYSAVRDLTGLMKMGEKSGELQRVVMVQFGPGKVIGFVTQENAMLPGLGSDEELVAVYMPMSYQIGGYTLYLPRDRIEPTDLTVEAAMRIVLTGGIQTQ
ncbi:MAG: DUF502 domain-containing protein [Gammaproteobacteria bacterium]|jgi:uncharacterized membrane protein|nr:DUF502 domain-containing protein [Gammaproteobacteria bacterium]